MIDKSSPEKYKKSLTEFWEQDHNAVILMAMVQDNYEIETEEDFLSYLNMKFATYLLLWKPK